MISSNNINVDSVFMDNDNLVFHGIHNNKPCILELNGSDSHKPNVVLDFLEYKCNLPRIICNNLNLFKITSNLKHYKLINIMAESKKDQYIWNSITHTDGGSFGAESNYYHVELGFDSLLLP